MIDPTASRAARRGRENAGAAKDEDEGPAGERGMVMNEGDGSK